MFNSNISKNKSLSLVKKLTSSLNLDENHTKKPKSSTEVLAIELSKPKTVKRKRNRNINKKIKLNQQDLKRINYELIKAKKGNLVDSNEKYLAKLIKRNKRLLINEANEEIEELQDEILNFTKPEKKNRNFIQQKFPGLTPGLAPVGYESDDE